jgi:DUF4097 and DUF4098 domain-containing protein YvlB
MRVVAIATSTVAVCIGLSGCVVGDFGPADRFHEDFHYTYPVDAKARIDAESFDGPIEIEGWDRNEVEISGSKYASSEETRNAIKIDVHHTPDSVEIRAIRPSSHQGNMGAKLTLRVPRTAEVDRVTTSNGEIRIQDVGRAAHLKSSNGSIRITGVHGEVDAHTSNASIDAESLDGAATLKTSNGRIHAEKIAGSLEAETSNGGIVARLDSSPSTPVKMITSNGSIDLTMDKSPQSDIRAQTKNSSITIHLPADASAKVSADTSNDSVSCDFAVTGGENEKGHLKGNIGAGGHTIELTTSNGRIRIAKGVE